MDVIRGRYVFRNPWVVNLLFDMCATFRSSGSFKNRPGLQRPAHMK